MEALRNTSIQLQNVPQSIHSLEYQEEEYRAALDAYKSSTLNSLQDVTAMQASIEALMRANDLLHKALKNVENDAPASLMFTHNGTPFTAVRAAGSYKVTWTEEVQKYDGRETGQVRGGNIGDFVYSLCRAYEGAQTRHMQEMAELESSMAEMNSELPDALAQAIRVRTAWERAEEVRRTKQLVKSRQEHVIETGHEMGFTSHVTEVEVEDEEEIIISLERFVETKSKSDGGMFGGSSMF
jgi:putative IMPACT (imprinted ancient) family translation regulator